MDSLANKYKYAQLYNYDFIPVFDDPINPHLPASWSKLSALMQYLPHYDWIWAADSDLMITNRNLTLEEHVLRDVPADKAFVVARDCKNYNLGSFLIRNVPASFALLDALYALRNVTTLVKYSVWYEQAAFVHLYDKDARVRSLVHTVQQHVFNSYAKPCGHVWRLGDFAVHFPGTPRKPAAWKEMLRAAGPKLRALLP